MNSPARVDLYVPNQADGWTLSSGAVGGRAGQPFAAAGAVLPDPSRWAAAVRAGELLPVRLEGSGPLVVRVVVGAPLTAAEEGAALDRVRARLSIPDGCLLIGGGAEHLLRAGETWMEANLRRVEVTPGTYDVEILTTIHSHNAAIPAEHADAEAWWRATRPGEPVPRWAQVPRGDDDEGGDPLGIDFVVHLRPADAAPAPELPLDELGWLPSSVDPGIPPQCPDGLLAREILHRPTRPSRPAGLRFRHEVFALVVERTPTPLGGGPLPVALDDLVALYWLAHFSGRTHPEVRVTGCAGFRPAVVGLDGDVFVTALPDGSGWSLEVEGDTPPRRKAEALGRIAGLLAGLPDGAVVELAAADRGRLLDPSAHRRAGDAGLHRHRGVVRAGRLLLEATAPSAEASTLSAMLDVARQGMRARVTLANADEERALLPAVKKELTGAAVERTADGALSLVPGPGDEPFGYLLGAWAFWARFRTVWPVANKPRL